MKTFAPLLLSWYHVHKRDLPWRHIRDPYKIWLCEIIMQQTRIAQGLEYYNRFVRTFPTPRALADASEDQVLKLWQGLGYYSRARNLHAAAKSMNGVFPTTYDGVRALKGVGDYTAAAICSIAFDMPYAVVDGNVYRVLARVFSIHTPIDSTNGKKEFTALAQKLLDPKHPGDFNQAMMDLGAMVCTPQAPQCGACPLAKLCKAQRAGAQETLPVKAQKTKISTRYFHYIYVEQGKFTWIHQRGAGDVWQHLYEVPLVETTDGNLPADRSELRNWFGTAKVVEVEKDTPPTRLRRTSHARGAGDSSPALRAPAPTRGEGNSKPSYPASGGTPSTREGEQPARKTLIGRQVPVKHVLSHQVIYAYIYKVKLPPARKVPAGFVKIPTAKLPMYAVSRLMQKLLEKI